GGEGARALRPGRDAGQSLAARTQGPPGPPRDVPRGPTGPEASEGRGPGKEPRKGSKDERAQRQEEELTMTTAGRKKTKAKASRKAARTATKATPFERRGAAGRKTDAQLTPP